MAFIVADRVQETTTSTGTSNISLAGASSNLYLPFSAKCANGDVTPYCIQHQTAGEWEVGMGTWQTGNILVRTVVLASSNAGALVNFSAGTKDVFLTQPAAYQHPSTICTDGLHPEYVATVPTPNRAATVTPAEYKHMSGVEFKTIAGAGLPTSCNYAGIHTIAPWSGITTGGGDPNYQVAYFTNAPGDTANPRMNIRAGIDATWGAWWSIPLVSPAGILTIPGARPIELDTTNGSCSIKTPITGVYSMGIVVRNPAAVLIGGFGVYGNATTPVVNYHWIGAGYADPIARFYEDGTVAEKVIPSIGPVRVDILNPENGPNSILWGAIAAGTPVFMDEEFATGFNGVTAYDNNTTGHVTCNRIANAQAPNSSGWNLLVAWDGIGVPDPPNGGFKQPFNSRANATFVLRFRARVSAGATLFINLNLIGSNPDVYWITPNIGTDKWEEYAYVVHCGNTGTFSTAGFVSIVNAGAAWYCYLASSNTYEINSPGVLNLTPAQVAKGIKRGSGVIDYGYYPGSNEASLVVSGQTNIKADSICHAEIQASITNGYADGLGHIANPHSASESAYAASLIAIACSEPTPGVGFTIYARSTEKLDGIFNIVWHWL